MAGRPNDPNARKEWGRGKRIQRPSCENYGSISLVHLAAGGHCAWSTEDNTVGRCAAAGLPRRHAERGLLLDQATLT